MLRPGLLLLAVALSATHANAQNAPSQALPSAPSLEAPQWQRVQALPIATSIQVSARTGHMPCTVKNIDANTLTCERDTGVGFKDVTFQRTQINKIKIKHRTRSALIGAGIGATLGAVIAGIAERNNHYYAVPAAFPMIGGFTGLFVGAPTGYLTDFTATTIYRAK